MNRHGHEALSHLVWEILQVGNRLVEAGNRLSAPFGLTAARWQVMGVITREPATVADIARRLSQTRQGVQRLADDMTRLELTAYAHNPRHARAKLLTPTDQGRAAYQGLMREQAKWIQALATHVQSHDLAAARALLASLEAGLRETTPQTPNT